MKGLFLLSIWQMPVSVATAMPGKAQLKMYQSGQGYDLFASVDSCYSFCESVCFFALCKL